MTSYNNYRNIPTNQQFKIVHRLLTIAAKYWPSFVISILAVIVQSTMNILLPRFLQYYMDHFLTQTTLSEKVILFSAVIYLVGVIIRSLGQFFTNFAFNMGSEYMLEDLRRSLFSKLHQLGMSYFDRTSAGSIVSRVNNDTMSLSDFMQVFLSGLVGIFSVLSALIAMWFTDKVAAIAVLLFLPLLIMSILIYNKYSSSAYRFMRQKLSEINTRISETIQGIDIIQNFRQQKRIQKEFEHTNHEYLQSRRSIIKINSLLLSPIVNLLYTLALISAMYILGWHAHIGFVQAGMIYAFTTYISQFFNPITNMMDTLSFFQDGVVAGSRSFHILDSKEYGPQQNRAAQGEITAGAIEFRHVSFAYPDGPEVLHDVSFKVNPGESLGIVGHTGSGKSTMINILLRFYEFQNGEILIDGQDIRNLPVSEIRQKIGLVLQDSYLFYGDINFNIRLYDQNVSDRQIQLAAKLVHADEFIQKLPQQYHTQVTPGGNGLSAGQKQLISFARTIVHQPSILVLDEATASIDTQTEDLIQTGLDRMRQDRTTIAIAHRLSTIKKSTNILVLDNGRVVEYGNHKELLKRKGYYYELYMLQEKDTF